MWNALKKFFQFVFKTLFVLANIAIGLFILWLWIVVFVEERYKVGHLLSPVALGFWATIVVSYLLNHRIQRALRRDEFPYLLQGFITLTWLILRAFCLGFLNELLKGGGEFPERYDWLENGAFAAMVMGLFGLISFLGYTKVVRDRVEARMLLSVIAFAKTVEGGEVEDERIKNILRKTEIIRQSIVTTGTESYSVSIPVMIAWPASKVAHYFGVHILQTTTSYNTSQGRNWQMSRYWTACWMGSVGGHLRPFRVESKTFGGFKVTDSEGAPPDALVQDRLFKIMQQHDLNAIEITPRYYLATRTLKARMMLFGVQPIPHAEITAVIDDLKFLKSG